MQYINTFGSICREFNIRHHIRIKNPIVPLSSKKVNASFRNIGTFGIPDREVQTGCFASGVPNGLFGFGGLELAFVFEFDVEVRGLLIRNRNQILYKKNRYEW